MQATCSCAARNIYNSLTNIEKKITSKLFSGNNQQNANNDTPSSSDSSFSDCECQPVKETCQCNSPDDLSNDSPRQSQSIDSQDIAMIDAIHGMAMEEQRLTSELKELSEKEKSYEKAMQFCNNMFANQSAPVEPENPQIKQLKDINKEMLFRNVLLKDEVADAKLELKQLKEKINGPWKRELERAKRRCLECECKCNEITQSGSAINNNEANFLKQQIENAYNNVADLQAINADIRQEVLVLNYKCNKLQELLIKNKVDEIDTIKNLATECDCD